MGFWKLLLARLLLGGLLFVACGEGLDTTPSSETTSPTTLAPSTSLGTQATTTTTRPTTTTQPTTTTATTSPDEIAIEGDEEFVEHANAALDLLEAEAPDSYLQVAGYIDTIRLVPAGSGMDVFTRTFLAGEQTAYAPGFNPADQRAWFAGSIAHDSCHSRLFATGESYTGRDAELECLMDQLDALETIDEGGVLVDYVAGLIDGVDDPANDYWSDPDRHW